MMDTAAAPTPPSAEAEAFFTTALHELAKSGIPHLLGGTYAVSAYTGITRRTKDLDVVCKPGDGLRILERFRHLGYTIEIEDERWLAKVFEGSTSSTSSLRPRMATWRSTTRGLHTRRAAKSWI